jgi:hypothetical protein
MLNKFAPMALVALLLPGLVFQTGCGASDKIVKGLDIAVEAAQVALPVLAAAGQVPAPLVPVLSTYLNVASTSVADTITELGSTDDGVTKAEKIRGYITAAALPDISKLNPAAQAYFTAVDAALAVILKQFQTPHMMAAIRMSGRTRMPADAMAHLAVTRAKALKVATSVR